MKILEAYGYLIIKKSKKKILLINSFHCTDISYNGFLKISPNYNVNVFFCVFILKVFLIKKFFKVGKKRYNLWLYKSKF